MSKTVLEPGPDHPITITPADRHVTVSVGGHTIAETDDALSLQEASYPAVLYIPLADADQSLLERTDHETYCPYKGDASYFSISAAAAGPEGENAVWQYQAPHSAVAEIKDRIAFYADRVQIS